MPEGIAADDPFDALLGDTTRPRRAGEAPASDPRQPRELVATSFQLLGHSSLWEWRTNGLRWKPRPFGRRCSAEASPAQIVLRAALRSTRLQRIQQRRLRRVYTWARLQEVATDADEPRQCACLPPCHLCGELTSNSCSGRVLVPPWGRVRCGWPLCAACERDEDYGVCSKCSGGIEAQAASPDDFAYGDSETDPEVELAPEEVVPAPDFPWPQQLG